MPATASRFLALAGACYVAVVGCQREPPVPYMQIKNASTSKIVLEVSIANGDRLPVQELDPGEAYTVPASSRSCLGSFALLDAGRRHLATAAPDTVCANHQAIWDGKRLTVRRFPPQ